MKEMKQNGSYGSDVLVLPHPLRNIEITDYLNYKPKFNGVFQRDNLCISEISMTNKRKEDSEFHYLLT